VEELKEFCDFVGLEYKQILWTVKTGWLSVQLAIGMFQGLNLILFPEKKAQGFRQNVNDPICIVLRDSG
jgi:hypothetical protein